MMMGQNWGFGWGGMWFGWLMMIGFIIAVVVLVVWLVRLSTPGAATRTESAGSDRRTPLALEILQARYARGEISKEEYLDARATLQT
jgi:putative membrane protein